MFRKGLALCFIVFLILIGIARSSTEGEPPSRVVSERLIARINPSWKQPTWIISPNSERVVCKFQVGNKWFVTVDGKVGKEYDGIGQPQFSPDSNRVAYIATPGKRGWFVVIDGKEEKQYDNIAQLIFSPDSMKVAYAAEVDNKWSVVIDGKEGKKYDAIGENSLKFSPDSNRVAYIAKLSGKWFVVLDGEEGKRYNRIGELRFSPDSKRLAYMMLQNRKVMAVVDERESKQYDNVAFSSWPYSIFSPDSSRVAYMAKLNGKWFVVADGEEGNPYDDVDAVGFPNNDQVVYKARLLKFWFVVSNGRTGMVYDTISDIVFSPDGRKVAYAAKQGDKWLTVIDGKEEEIPVKDEVYPEWVEWDHQLSEMVKKRPGVVSFEGFPRNVSSIEPVFSPDSKRVAYEAIYQKPSEWVFEGGGHSWRPLDLVGKKVVIDGTVGKKYDDVGTIVFSPDSKQLAYTAKLNDKWFVVWNGEEGKEYDGILGKIVFEAANRLHYPAKREDGIYLVEECIK